MIKTGFLFAVLTGLLLAVSVVAGVDPIIAIALAGIVNFLVYLFSERIVLSMTRAKEVSPSEAPRLHWIVESLASRAGTPKPRIYIVENNAPNAFATGRSPSRAAICVHTGLLNILTRTR